MSPLRDLGYYQKVWSKVSGIPNRPTSDAFYFGYAMIPFELAAQYHKEMFWLCPNIPPSEQDLRDWMFDFNARLEDTK